MVTPASRCLTARPACATIRAWPARHRSITHLPPRPCGVSGLATNQKDAGHFNRRNMNRREQTLLLRLHAAVVKRAAEEDHDLTQYETTLGPGVTIAMRRIQLEYACEGRSIMGKKEGR